MSAAVPVPDLLAGVPRDAWLRVCWAEKRNGGCCAGTVTWTRVDGGEWRSKCGRCSAVGLAAVGERAALDAMNPNVGAVP
jgi:hypothetical protein